ncbi:MAG: membrane integrity-associated transporter subunit PqiC [Elusimicrobiaceae bacterium]|nr:membrane integrity-associated transporter subunit PqiC [Elusimicrobiaceae bacterium]
MKLIKIIIPCLLLNACVFGTSQTSKFYTQTATSAEPVSLNYTSLVGVSRIQLPKYMDRPQMLTQLKNSAQINISEYNRWVESPAVLATRVLTEDLSALLPAAQIKMNQLKGEHFDRTVSVEITKLDAVLGDKADMVAWYTIKDKAGQVLVHQKFTDMVLIGRTYDDLAKGYSELLADLSQEIAAVLIKK